RGDVVRLRGVRQRLRQARLAAVVRGDVVHEEAVVAEAQAVVQVTVEPERRARERGVGHAVTGDPRVGRDAELFQVRVLGGPGERVDTGGVVRAGRDLVVALDADGCGHRALPLEHAVGDRGPTSGRTLDVGHAVGDRVGDGVRQVDRGDVGLHGDRVADRVARAGRVD